MKTTLAFLFFACSLTACKNDAPATTTTQADTKPTYQRMQLEPLTKADFSRAAKAPAKDNAATYHRMQLTPLTRAEMTGAKS